MNTLEAFESAMNLAPDGPVEWASYWESQGFNPDELEGVLRRSAISAVGESLAAPILIATSMHNLALGYILGRMSCDPAFGLTAVGEDTGPLDPEGEDDIERARRHA